jgi:hypothetical protein
VSYVIPITPGADAIVDLMAQLPAEEQRRYVGQQMLLAVRIQSTGRIYRVPMVAGATTRWVIPASDTAQMPAGSVLEARAALVVGSLSAPMAVREIDQTLRLECSYTTIQWQEEQREA